MATIEEMQKRIQRLEDIKQIGRLQRIYGYYHDYEEWGKIVDLFSDNAESVEIVDHGVFYGKKGIRRIYWDMFAEGGTLRQSLPTASHPYPYFINNVPYHYQHPITGE